MSSKRATLTSDEINLLIYRYMEEGGLSHSAFTFAHESLVARAQVADADVPPGALVSLLQKGLQFAELEREAARGLRVAATEEIEKGADSLFSSAAPVDMSLGDDEIEQEGRVKSIEEPSAGTYRLATLRKHGGEAFEARWSCDGRFLATCAADGTARIWSDDAVVASFEGGGGVGSGGTNMAAAGDSEGGAPFRSLVHSGEGGHRQVVGLDWDPSGTRLATACEDGVARVWGVDGTLVGELSHSPGSTLHGVRWSKTGEGLLTFGSDRAVMNWEEVDEEEGKWSKRQTLLQHEGPVLDAAWQSDASFATAGSDTRIFLWRSSTDRPFRAFEAHSGEVNAIRWDSGGNLLASCSDDRLVRLWNQKDGLARSLSAHTAEVMSVSWGPKSAPHMLVSASVDGTARLWDVRSAQNVTTFDKHGDQALHTAEISPDGVLVATGTMDGLVRLWDPRDGKPICSRRCGGPVFTLDWNPDATRLAISIGTGHVAVIELRAPWKQ